MTVSMCLQSVYLRLLTALPLSWHHRSIFHINTPLMFKGYWTSLWINCGISKLLAQARACEGLLTSDLAIPQFMNECDNPIIIYLLPHFGDVLDKFRFYIRTDKTQNDHILAVVHRRKRSHYLRNQPIISWSRRVCRRFGGSAIVQLTN